MRKEYHKNDFTLPLRLLDRNGAEVAVGDRDFTAVFVTGSSMAFHPAVSRMPARYVASRKEGRAENCLVDGRGRITVVFDNHRLPPGMLQCELTVFTPDATYPDGTRREVFRGAVGVMLTMEPVRAGGDGEADGFLRMDYVQGMVPVLSHVELVTDKAVYRLPVTGEAPTREEFPPEPSGYYYDNSSYSIGEWDV